MGIGPRKIIAAIGLLAGLVATGGALAPAQAAPAAGTATAVRAANGDLVLHLPRQAAAGSEVAAAPTTSPAARHRYWIAGGQTTNCESGYACAAVPYNGGWYIFKFYTYGGYSLSNWFGTGQVWNNQTGGAAMRWDNSGGGQIGCAAPTARPHVDWDPVWRIRLTTSGC